jgi:hypothetical protein
MSRTGKHIVEAYSELLNGLSKADMEKVMARLSDAIKENRSIAKDAFYASFGGFASELSAEDIVADLRASRKFRKRDVGL